MKNDDNTIKLMLAYLCVSKEAEASLIRKVEILDRFALQDSEISTVCGGSIQAVRNARHLRKKGSHAKANKE
jgi:hypothetical protein